MKIIDKFHFSALLAIAAAANFLCFVQTPRAEARLIQVEQQSPCIQMDGQLKGTNTCHASVTVTYCTYPLDPAGVSSCANRKYMAGETVIFPAGATIQGYAKDSYRFGEPSTTAVLWTECADVENGMKNSSRGPIGKCAGDSRPAHVFDTRTGGR